MSLKALIQEALGECAPCTIECTLPQTPSAQYPPQTTNTSHIQTQLVQAIQTYCRQSRLHSDVQALIDDTLRQTPHGQTELLAHFQAQAAIWQAIYADNRNHDGEQTNETP